ncbi:CidA/LrgA family protein [Providencia rettgeri]|uniref:CidA/LrgA family protein n=1 Tax=Providencia rettgeri TaxID=587 RepID=UPI0034E0A8E1
MSFKQVLITGWQYLRAFAILYFCLIVGNLISTLLPFAIPGSIVGMLILFALLALQIIPAHWAQPGCSILLKNMTILFVPIGVGIMNYYDLLSQQLIPIVVSCVVSTLIVMIVVAISSNYIHKERPVVGAKPDEVSLPPEDPLSSVINNDKTKGKD